MTAMERIKEIEKRIDPKWEYGPFLGMTHKETPEDVPSPPNGLSEEEKFLLRAFRVMQEIVISGYLDGTYCGSEEGAKEWLNTQFEERMAKE